MQLIGSLKYECIEEFYGKLASDIVGGGRASYSSAGVSWGRLREYVAELKRHGIAFNYLLNSACLGNHEWDRRWQKKLNRLLGRLVQLGIARLTVSTPVLLKIVKKRFPQFHCKVGIYAQVDTAARARFWEDNGADEITLESFSINRNFERLRSVRRAVCCGLQLIVNHPCLSNCPLQYYHQNGFAHSSSAGRRLFIDYCVFRCAYERLKDPVQFIKSQWIRPSDIDAYEALGYDRFKLLERNMPSDRLRQRINAYIDKRFDGNLAALILPYGFATSRGPGWLGLMRYFFHPLQMPPWKLKPVYDLAKAQGMMFPTAAEPIVIDSRQLPRDFLASLQGRPCAAAECDQCGYCRDIAEHAVHIDPAYRRAVLERFEHLDTMIAQGDLWHV